MTEREEQAIIVLNTLYNNPLLSDIHRQALEVGIKAIKAQSSSENPNKWIPCSERLPNFAGVYLVTRYFPNNVMNPTYLVDACFFDGIDTWHNDNRINHDRKYLTNVVAWLEEPEPYKEIPTWAEGSEKECTKNI